MTIRQKNSFFFCLLLFFPFSLLQCDINWSVPVTISSENLNSSDPQVVIDTLGNATAIWMENNSIMASSRPINGSWNAPVTLSTNSSSPKLSVDSSGNVTALWLTDGIVNSSILNFGGSWSMGLPVSNVLGGASSLSLSVDASGNAVAVWVRGGFIESSTRTLGLWSIVSKISAANSDFPQVAISANGTVIAVWHSVVAGADVIVSATEMLGGNWNSAKNVFNGVAALKHNYPKVSIDANGNAYLVWFRYNLLGAAYQNVTVLTSALSYNASSWTFPSFLSNAGIRNPADLMLKIACDDNGNLIAFWTNSYDGQIFYVESASMLFGKGWGNAVMPYIPSLYSLASDISVNSKGDVLATYMTFDGSLLQIQSQESNIGSPIFNAWTFSKELSQGSENGYPKCALTLSGNVINAVVAWIKFEGSNSVIQATVGSELVVMPPTNLTLVQNRTDFGVYSDFCNTISWQPSPSPNIQRYNIYRNGIFFTATDSNTLQINDHNTIQNGPVTYGVAAQDINYSQSSIAIISFQ